MPELRQIQRTKEIRRGEHAEQAQMHVQLAQQEALQSTRPTAAASVGDGEKRRLENLVSLEKDLTHVSPFIREHGKPFEMPKRIYAVLDDFEPLADRQVNLVYGGVDADYLQRNKKFLIAASRRQEFDEIYRQLPIFLFEVSVPDKALRDLLGDVPRMLDAGTAPGLPEMTAKQLESAARRLETRWVELSFLGGDGAVEGKLYRNLFVDAEPVSVSSIHRVTQRATLRALAALNPLPAVDATEDKIKQALGPSLGAIDRVTFLDVGQGSSNALLGSGTIRSYFDFGGGVAGNLSTFPRALGMFCFCASTTPPIILSHWDHDHWSSSGRDKRAYGTTWLAPRQPAKGSGRAPHHSALIAAIAPGKLLVWPSKLTTLTVGQLIIRKCRGKSKNSSGLAVEISPPAPLRHCNPVLLPADAGYRDIGKGISSRHFDAIACPHHGGRSNSSAVPKRPGLGSHERLTYSYGQKNTYKHPLAPTYTRHHNSGKWFDARISPAGTTFVRNTETRGISGLGHIGFDWGVTGAAPFVCTCRSDLQAQQT